MKKAERLNWQNKNGSRWLLYYFLLLIIPALFINLGLMPFILDEATRANVALEMLYSGDFFVPKINGEFYYNKPPLFNWIQILFVKITGSTSEFSFRLPVVLSLIFFAFTVYQTQKVEGGRKLALFSAVAVLTCGRILFYDSFRGLIDISFSWVIYLMFWSIYSYGRKNELLKLFFSSYLLATIAFMMKGLPALVFLGISLLIYFIYNRKFKKLFSFYHLAGAGIFITITVIYLLLYSRQNAVGTYLETLWNESSKRTFIDNSLWDSIKHLFLFPVDFLYHFLPWTLFVVVFFLKDSINMIRSDQFAKFSFMVFIANIIVYWVSPAIFPRYLFMFLPLFFYPVFLIYTRAEESIIVRKFLNPLIVLICILLGGLILSAPFISERELYSFFYLKYLLLIVIASPVYYFLIVRVKEKILILAAMLLVARIGFNWFVFPDRIENGTELYQKNGAIVTGELSLGHPLYIYGDTRIHHASTFYIMKTREDILKRWDEEPVPSVFYIIEKEDIDKFPSVKTIYSFETRIEALRLYLVRIENSDPGINQAH